MIKLLDNNSVPSHLVLLEPALGGDGVIEAAVVDVAVEHTHGILKRNTYWPVSTHQSGG